MVSTFATLSFVVLVGFRNFRRSISRRTDPFFIDHRWHFNDPINTIHIIKWRFCRVFHSLGGEVRSFGRVCSFSANFFLLRIIYNNFFHISSFSNNARYVIFDPEADAAQKKCYFFLHSQLIKIFRRDKNVPRDLLHWRSDDKGHSMTDLFILHVCRHSSLSRNLTFANDRLSTVKIIESATVKIYH